MTRSSCELVPPRSMLVALLRNRILRNRRVAPLRVADLEIDALRQRVRQGTRELRLSAGEHIISYTLAASAGAVVSYRDAAEALGRTDPESETTRSRAISQACAGSSGITPIAPATSRRLANRLPLRRTASDVKDTCAPARLVAYLRA